MSCECFRDVPSTSEFKPFDNVAFAHLLNSSLAAVAPVCPTVALRTTGAGRAAARAATVGTVALLTARTVGGVVAAGPVGTLTFPPAPTVDHDPPSAGIAA